MANAWHKQLRSGVEKRRNRRPKPVRDYSGGYSGNSHQRRKQRRAFERAAEKFAALAMEPTPLFKYIKEHAQEIIRG